MAEDIQTVWNAIDAEVDYVTDLTREMVRIPSVNPKFEVGNGINREAEVQAVIYGRTGDGFHGDNEYVDIASLIRRPR